MRIYYDELTKNIVLGTASRLFATGSLVAMQDRGRVSIVYKETNFPEAHVRFQNIEKQDGSPAGLSIDNVIAYLNAEFDNTPFTQQAGAEGYALIAGQNLIAYKVLTTNALGRAIYASADNIAHQNRIVGLSANSALTGGSVTIKESGDITNQGWNFTVGALLYLGVNGDITPSQTGLFSNSIGYAVTDKTVKVRIGRSIVRA